MRSKEGGGILDVVVTHNYIILFFMVYGILVCFRGATIACLPGTPGVATGYMVILQ
ncbi:hypothetical protein HOY80DRAFT_943217 [Tuber brumale]|nr:hypothetical protein HOY80DRAFT_943217 [Tuber brumale]